MEMLKCEEISAISKIIRNFVAKIDYFCDKI